MQLKLRRTQREGGVISKNVIFCLDARAQLTPEERQNLTRYKLYNQVIYNSESAKRSLEKSIAHTEAGGVGNFVKGMAHLAITAMKLNITIGSLERGHHIECKDMDELLAAEDALYTACDNLKKYLDVAATFDGTELIVAFDGGQPAITTHPAMSDPRVIAPAPKPVPQLKQTAMLAAPAVAPEVIEDAQTEPVSFADMMQDTQTAPEEPAPYHQPAEAVTAGRYADEFGSAGFDDIKRMYEKNPVVFWILATILLLFFIIKML